MEKHLQRHEEQFKNEMNKALRWKVSLAAAGKLSGWDCAVNRHFYAISSYHFSVDCFNCKALSI